MVTTSEHWNSTRLQEVRAQQLFTKDLSSITVCSFIYNHLTDQPSGIGRKLEGMENRERLFLEQTEQGTLRSPDLDNLLYSLELNSENSNDELGSRLKFKELLLECLKINLRALDNELD